MLNMLIALTALNDQVEETNTLPYSNQRTLTKTDGTRLTKIFSHAMEWLKQII